MASWELYERIPHNPAGPPHRQPAKSQPQAHASSSASPFGELAFVRSPEFGVNPASSRFVLAARLTRRANQTRRPRTNSVVRLAVTPNRQELDPRGSIRTLRGGPNVVQKFPESFFIYSHPALFRRRLSIPDEPASPCSESEWESIGTAVQHAGGAK